VEALFLFAIVWSVGATTDDKGRGVFDAFLRSEMVTHGSPWRFPKEGKVYDYVFDQVCGGRVGSVCGRREGV
jgi:dynein heavy chain, axonemal